MALFPEARAPSRRPPARPRLDRRLRRRRGPRRPTARSRSQEPPEDVAEVAATSTPTASRSGSTARPVPTRALRRAPARRRLRLPRRRRARPAVPAARQPARHGGAERRLPAARPSTGSRRRPTTSTPCSAWLDHDGSRLEPAGRRTSTATAPAATSRWSPRCATRAGSGRWCCIYPFLDPTAGFASYDARRRRGLRPARGARGTGSSTPPAPADLTNPDLAPLLSDRLGTLPPTLVITAEHDPLRDEGEHLAALIAEAGRPGHRDPLPRPAPRLLAARGLPGGRAADAADRAPSSVRSERRH